MITPNGQFSVTPILQAVTIALILWFGAKVTMLSEAVALQDYRITTLENVLGIPVVIPADKHKAP